MLGGMRSFVKSKWAIALFALLVAGLVLTMGDPFSGVMSSGLARVGDRTIDQRDLSREVDRELTTIREETGEILSQRDAAQRGITQQALARLIYRNAALEFAETLGVRASVAAVSNVLSDAPAFKDALGRTDVELIRQFAAQRNQSVAQFEAALREELTVGYLATASISGLVTPDALSRPLLNYFGESRTLSIARLTNTSIEEPSPPTDEQAQAWYNENANRFRQPERRRISVLSYSPEDFLDKVEITEEMVQAQYAQRIRDFSTPQTRQIAQFSAPTRAAVQAFIDTVKQGVSLNDALGRSEGVSRADLTVKPGDITDPQYNDLVFALPANQLQGPLRVGENWFAVEVMSITEGVAKPLEEVAEQIRAEIRQTESRRLYDQSYENFYDMAGGLSLEEIGQQIGAPVIELAPVDASGRTRGGQQSSLLLDAPDAFRSLFELGEGQMTDVIESENKRAIMRVDEILEPYTLAYEEVKDEVRLLYLREKVQEAALQVANDMVADVKAGATFEKAAADRRLAVLGRTEISRAAAPAIDPQVAAGAFSLPVGEASVIVGQNGEPWVVRVEAITPLSPEAAESLKPQIDGQIAESLLNDMQEVFFRGIQQAANVRTNDKAISDYIASLTQDQAE